MCMPNQEAAVTVGRESWSLAETDRAGRIGMSQRHGEAIQNCHPAESLGEALLSPSLHQPSLPSQTL